MNTDDIPADRNKTDLTHAITEAAAKWLALIGAKCIETEVFVGDRWYADLAAFWRPTVTEASDVDLIPRYKSYPKGKPPAAAKVLEWEQYMDARKAAHRALPNIITIAVEVKTSRSDLSRDLKDKFLRPPIADLQIIAAPHALLKIEDAVNGWWLLGIGDDNPENVDVWRRNESPLVPTSMEQRLNFVAAVGERRHNRTSNALWSQLAKRQRLEESSRRGER